MLLRREGASDAADPSHHVRPGGFVHVPEPDSGSASDVEGVANRLVESDPGVEMVTAGGGDGSSPAGHCGGGCADTALPQETLGQKLVA